MHSVNHKYISIIVHSNWSPFTFSGNSTQEPESIVCDNEHVTYFILKADTDALLVTANTGKTLGRFWKKNEGKWTEKVEIT